MIGINYSYENMGKKIILKNYLLFVGYKYGIISTTECDSGGDDLEQKKEIILNELEKRIKNNSLLDELGKKENDVFFDGYPCREILYSAYDLEINLKYKNKKIDFDENAAKQTINFFNELYGFDFHKHIESFYVDEFDQKKYTEFRSFEYSDPNKVINIFLDFVYNILLESGFNKELKILKNNFKKNPIKIIVKKGINGYVNLNNLTIGNNLVTTLLHELTHLVNNCFSANTKTYKKTIAREGFANFVSYNFFDIMFGSSDSFDTSYLYDPIYSKAYYHIIEFGGNSKEKNYKLISNFLLKNNYSSKDKIHYFYNRFYKFFHYSQNKYLYPKELTYEIGYKKTMEEFKKSHNWKNLCAKYFLGLFG